MAGDGSIFPVTIRDPRTGRTRHRWRAQLSIGGRGRRQYLTRTVETRAEARTALAQLQADAAGGASSRTMTVSDWLERWVRDARNIRPSTRHGYEAAIVTHIGPTIGRVQLARLSPLDVERMLAELAPRMSAKHLRNVHAVLRRALGQAVRAGLVRRNVAAREFVDAPRVELEEPDALTVGEVRRLLEAAAGDRLEAVFVLAVTTGLRQGELLGLAWEDLDLAGGRLHVRRELTHREGEYRREEPKTERSKRTVPLAPIVVDALARHRERLVAAGFLPTSTGPVFSSTTGGPLNGSWLTHHFYGLLERAGVRRLPFKVLRATYSSRLYEAGVPELTIAGLMGHARTATTKRHYIATAGLDQDDAVAAVERMVAG
jgi:integrase